MMSGIKGRRRRNDGDELSEHSQDAEIVVRQESNVIFEKAIQSETRNDNEKIFSHEFNENDAVDYTAFVEKKRAQNKNLKAKKEYQILLERNKRLQIFLQNDEVVTTMHLGSSGAINV